MMRIVLGENNKKNNLFSKKYNALLASEMCGIKFIDEEVEIYIPYEIVLDNGMISNTNLFIEEVLITLNIKCIYLNQPNSLYLKEIADYYQIKIYTDFSV